MEYGEKLCHILSSNSLAAYYECRLCTLYMCRLFFLSNYTTFPLPTYCLRKYMSIYNSGYLISILIYSRVSVMKFYEGRIFFVALYSCVLRCWVWEMRGTKSGACNRHPHLHYVYTLLRLPTPVIYTSLFCIHQLYIYIYMSSLLLLLK